MAAVLICPEHNPGQNIWPFSRFFHDFSPLLMYNEVGVNNASPRPQTQCWCINEVQISIFHHFWSIFPNNYPILRIVNAEKCFLLRKSP